MIDGDFELYFAIKCCFFFFTKLHFLPSLFSIEIEEFGEIRDKMHWLNNSAILNDEECLSLVEMTKSSNGKLLYRATQDGFTSLAFHSKCDNKANTITIIKNNLNYVFGGYTSVSWTSLGNYSSDSNAFIFNLRRNGVSKSDKFMIKNLQNEKHAINGNINNGPTFGGGHDIYICNQSNANFGSYAYFGHSYQLPNGCLFGTPNALNFLAGNYNQWLVYEIEVYQIN